MQKDKEATLIAGLSLRPLKRGEYVATRNLPVLPGVILDGYENRSQRLTVIFGPAPNVDFGLMATTELQAVGEHEFIVLVAVLKHDLKKALLRVEEALGNK